MSEVNRVWRLRKRPVGDITDDDLSLEKEGIPEVAGPYNYPMILMKRLRVEGFIVLDYADRYPEAIAELSQWMAAGKIKVRQDVVDGLDNALQAVKKLLTGANTGKLMVRVKDA